MEVGEHITKLRDFKGLRNRRHTDGSNCDSSLSSCHPMSIRRGLRGGLVQHTKAYDQRLVHHSDVESRIHCFQDEQIEYLKNMLRE